MGKIFGEVICAAASGYVKFLVNICLLMNKIIFIFDYLKIWGIMEGAG